GLPEIASRVRPAPDFDGRSAFGIVRSLSKERVIDTVRIGLEVPRESFEHLRYDRTRVLFLIFEPLGVPDASDPHYTLCPDGYRCRQPYDSADWECCVLPYSDPIHRCCFGPTCP